MYNTPVGQPWIYKTKVPKIVFVAVIYGRRHHFQPWKGYSLRTQPHNNQSFFKNSAGSVADRPSVTPGSAENTGLVTDKILTILSEDMTLVENTFCFMFNVCATFKQQWLRG